MPGVAAGPALLREDLARVSVRRVEGDALREELSRLARALASAGHELARLAAALPAPAARVLDAHAHSLKHPVLLTDVEQLILEERLALESALAKVQLDFAGEPDLHEAAQHLLRQLAGAPPPARDHVLVTGAACLADLVPAGPGRVRALACEHERVADETVVLARALGVPLVAGVAGLLDAVRPGDDLEVNGDRGAVSGG